jgi:hypothetical protein
MQGYRERSGSLFLYVTIYARILAIHPLRRIRSWRIKSLIDGIPSSVSSTPIS